MSNIANIKKETFPVTGIKCGGCMSNVEDKIKAQEGVLAVKGSLQDKTVYIEFDDTKILHDGLKRSLDGTSYELQV
ncbi:heavy-metal-associated domain-containing protein [Xanthovirga aplysinae]|uniref:heavy-metal-associated domain-containing protein n=1 Tax=Xanthovirga aplysinae TaxID=2529853 RepID=UPI0012BC2FD1|nr:heavy-metal-associated domain-containing protein [Xanthovirga aplysinae]MTI30187.1 copper chaperone [Xanthovirga aplysinae]